MPGLHTHLGQELNVGTVEGNETYNHTYSYLSDIKIVPISYFNNHIPVTHKSPM